MRSSLKALRLYPITPYALNLLYFSSEHLLLSENMLYICLLFISSTLLLNTMGTETLSCFLLYL